MNKVYAWEYEGKYYKSKSGAMSARRKDIATSFYSTFDNYLKNNFDWKGLFIKYHTYKDTFEVLPLYNVIGEIRKVPYQGCSATILYCENYSSLGVFYDNKDNLRISFYEKVIELFKGLSVLSGTTPYNIFSVSFYEEGESDIRFTIESDNIGINSRKEYVMLEFSLEDYSVTICNEVWGRTLDKKKIGYEKWCNFCDFVNNNFDFKDRLCVSFIHNVEKSNFKEVSNSKSFYSMYIGGMRSEDTEPKKVLIGEEELQWSCENPEINGYFLRVSKTEIKFTGKFGENGIHLNTGDVIKLDTYKVFDDLSGYVLVHSSKFYVSVGIISDIKNINGTTTLWGIVRYENPVSFKQNKPKSYYSCLGDTKEDVQKLLKVMDGGIISEKNYFGEMVRSSKYYRYAGLRGIKDYKFSTFMFFDNYIFAYYRFNNSIKCVKVKGNVDKKVMLENVKKIINIPCIRKLFIQRDYIFNVYEANSKISAKLDIGKRYIGNSIDLPKFIEQSKDLSMRDIIFCISCINKKTNTIEQKIVVHDGFIIDIDGSEVLVDY